MTEYFPSIRRWVVPLCMVTLFLGPTSYWGFFTGGFERVLVACITAALLAGGYFLVVARMRRPLLSVDGNKILVRGMFFGARIIEDLREYKLVISGDFVAFRKADEQDIMVDKADFSGSQWNTLLNALRCLPFAAVVSQSTL